MTTVDTGPAKMGSGSPLVLMGVAGSGKSTVGIELAQLTGAPFFDGDHFHPPANIAKMRAGQPLNDVDREDWLRNIATTLAEHALRGAPCIVACSALKARYRDRLRAAVPSLRIAHLDLSQSAATARVAARVGHYMPPSLVVTQFADLEPPRNERLTRSFDAEAPVVDLAERIRNWWLAPPSMSAGDGR